MHGTLVVSDDLERGETSVPLLGAGEEQEDDGDYYNSEEMGSFESESVVMSTVIPEAGDYHHLQTSSYVPPGYMVVEAGSGVGSGGAEYERFQQFSVSSL